MFPPSPSAPRTITTVRMGRGKWIGYTKIGTSIFQAMRLLATTQACITSHDPPVDPREILQKSFYFLADLANRINDHRKGQSILDSLVKESVLFSKEDVATA